MLDTCLIIVAAQPEKSLRREVQMKPLPPAIARTLYALLPAGVNYLYSPSKTGLTIAHCLDYDLVCSGDDHKIAGSRLDHLVGAYIGRAFWRGDPALFAKALFG